MSELVIDSYDPKLLADFWCQVLGLRVLEEEDGYFEIGTEEGFGGLQPTLISSRRPGLTQRALALTLRGQVVHCTRHQSIAPRLGLMWDRTSADSL